MATRINQLSVVDDLIEEEFFVVTSDGEIHPCEDLDHAYGVAAFIMQLDQDEQVKICRRYVRTQITELEALETSD